MFIGCTRIFPYLSALGFTVGATAHWIGAGGVISMAWFFLFAIGAGVVRVYEIPMSPTIAPTISTLGLLFGGLRF